MSPLISIIIVSWNVRALLRACLDSIEATKEALPVEVIVVDGNSHDGSGAMVREAFPQVQLIACDENVGFPRGNNLGLAQANGRYLYLLNPDTIVTEGALQTMLAYMQENADVGVVGAQLHYPDGSVQSSRRRFPTLATPFWESTWLQPYAPASILRHYYMEESDDDALVDADWVMGASMFVRREVYEQVGGMDADYFMYSEELDWCRRIKKAGWRVVYLPTAHIIHYEGKSSGQVVTHRHVYFNRAKLRYFRKYHGGVFAFVLRLFLLLGYVVQIGLEGGKGILGHKRPLRWQRVRAYWQVLKTGLPPAG